MPDRNSPDNHPDSPPRGPQEAPDQLSSPTGKPSDVERRARRKNIRPLAQCLLQQLVDDAWIGFAGHGLHHLADEEAEQLVLAPAIFGDLV